ncbi:major facilitator superfamily domain-containing protein [Mycena galopus ATCC 62051]|nr:major facilitator superfamily domain-containing protein [Mycena galopus ATCC 62051]
MLSTLLVALDQTIISTALPRIASDFNSFSLQGWISDSYILAQTIFLLVHGKFLRIFAAKWVLVSGIVLFELGSLLCGLAQDVGRLIAGRTVSGIGAAAIWVSMLQIISQTTRLEDRPRLFGLVGSLFGFSSVVGPLLGGAFTDTVTWRWIFFINLPVGGIALAFVLLALAASPPLGSDPAARSPKALLNQVLHMDIVGFILVATAVTCLVLSLQWGGNTKKWDDASVIACCVVSGLTAIAFIFWEKYLGDDALAPITIFKSRSMCVFLLELIIYSCLLRRYGAYIPIFYQAVRHSSAITSGIDFLPFILSGTFTSLICGQVVSRIGYIWPFLAMTPVFLGIGSGLLYSLETNTSGGKIAAFQILVGIGTGLGLQNSLLVIQFELKEDPKLIGQAMSMGSFAQFLGGTIGLGVAETVFSSQLSKNLRKYAPSAPIAIVAESPTFIYNEIPVVMIPGVVRAYTASLKIVFLVCLPIGEFDEPLSLYEG